MDSQKPDGKKTITIKAVKMAERDGETEQDGVTVFRRQFTCPGDCDALAVVPATPTHLHIFL